MPEAKAQSFLKEYTKSPPGPNEDDDEYRAYSFGHVGSRSQAMITFIKQDDYVEAISYAKLDRVYSSDIVTQLRLDFGDRQVLIEGTNLRDLFRHICSNRCSDIVEQSKQAAISTHDGQPIVVKLEVYRSHSK